MKVIMTIHPVELADAKRISEIYGHYVRHTPVTFEVAAPSPSDMRDRIETVTRLYPWLVCEVDCRVEGYAFASRYKDRESYRYAAEVSVYIDKVKVGQGIGGQLFKELIEALKKTDAAVLIAGVALPNERSLRMLDRFGFTRVAVFEKVGYKFGEWIDVGYWQLELKDRRNFHPA